MKMCVSCGGLSLTSVVEHNDEEEEEAEEEYSK